MSVERAGYATINHPFNLFIDEATMISYLDILPIVQQQCNSICITGDEEQIGKIDMTKFFGKSHELNLFNYMPKRNVETRNYTYRYGKTLLAELQMLIPHRKLESRAQHDTRCDIV